MKFEDQDDEPLVKKSPRPEHILKIQAYMRRNLPGKRLKHLKSKQFLSIEPKF